MRRFLPLLLALLVLTVANGCATYWKDRGNDLLDAIPGVRLIAGGGSRIGIGLGEQLDPANFGWYNYRKYGWDKRAIGAWDESGTDFFFHLEHDMKAVGGNNAVWESVGETRQVEGEMPEASREYPVRTHRNIGDFQFTLVPFAIGVEASASPLQIIDFVLGLVTIDMCKDDTAAYEAAKREKGEVADSE